MKKLTQRLERRRDAFTLLELLIVLAIIVAIAAMVAPNLLSSQQDANISLARTTIKNIEDAFKRKAVKMNGVFEAGTGTDKIQALSQEWEDSMGKKQQPLMEGYSVDPWQNDYQYSFDSNTDQKPKIWSFGPDGQDNGGDPDSDDVSNVIRPVQ